METHKLAFARSSAYEIQLGCEILQALASKISRLGLGKKCFILTNETVARWYLEPLAGHLRDRGFEVVTQTLPDGEQYKTLQHATSVFPSLFGAEMDRTNALVTLGGGVIGDLGGFVASIFKRGIPLIQIPTSLLAMVDACVGGKVAVNVPEGKNLIGSFYQPAFVGIDVAVLRTLPLSQLAYGLAEAIKHGAVADAAYFNFIFKNREAMKNKDLALLQRLVRRSIHIKKSFVEEDELDHGKRQVLNFGHTFGHAYELLGEFLRFHHGEAVGLGMLSALAVARKMGILKDDYTANLEKLLEDLGLPTRIPREWSLERISQAMCHDKKRQKGKVKFVLPVALGKVEIVPVDISGIPEFLGPLSQLFS